MSVSTNKINLIHNPLERLKKSPTCWSEISSLINNAKSSVFIQSQLVHQVE